MSRETKRLAPGMNARYVREGRSETRQGRVGLMKTDFCVVAFPKCGTTAIASMLDASPNVCLAKANGKMESPFFVPDRKLGPPPYEAGKLNGHKYSAYLYSINLMRSILEDSPRVLFIIMVRSAGAALLSWRQMHQQMAERNEPNHFVTRSEEARKFYIEASLEDYYREYADKPLDYAQQIERLQKFLPKANFVVISQRRLAEAPLEVIAYIHARLGAFAEADYLNSLPKGYTSRGNRDLGAMGLSQGLLASLAEKDAKLYAILEKLDPSDVLLGPERLL
jgi:hypothetical protein